MEPNNHLNSQALVADFCSRFDIRPVTLPHTVAGPFEVVNPDQKDLGELVGKIWRKMSEENIDHDYINGHEAEIFNLLRDYARCGVLMADFQDAPLLIETVRNRLGGEISVHNRDTYKAFHLHTQVAGINCEVQFHTYETYDLKLASDASYKKWRKPMAENKAAVEANPDYIEEHKVISPMCNAIYGRSGFDAALPAIEKLRTTNQAVPKMTYNNIVHIYRQAGQVQEQLLNIVQTELKSIALDQLTVRNHDLLTPAEIGNLLNTINGTAPLDQTAAPAEAEPLLVGAFANEPTQAL